MRIVVGLTLFLLIGILTTFYLLSHIFAATPEKTVFLSPLAETNLLEKTNSNQSTKNTEISLSSPLPAPVNILLLGLDGRKGDSRPRCDAIHMLTFDPEKNKIRIISVPRGTPVDVLSVSEGSNYIANSCHTKGIDFVASKIEKITKIHPDYIIKVNFSQTLGILRLLGLPTTPTLQFLRNRRFGIGDYQRSHNQAQFLKDALLNHLETFTQLPKPIKYLVFNLLDTNLDFEIADNILDQIIKQGINKDATSIELVTIPLPHYKTKEIHFPEDEFASPDSWQNDQQFKEYQNNLTVYLENQKARAEKYVTLGQTNMAFKILQTLFPQKLWLQIENEEERNQIYFDLLRVYVLASPKKNVSAKLLLDFITEMEVEGEAELKQEAEELLAEITT